MKEIKEMTEKELTDWAINKMKSGRSFREIEYVFKQNGIDENVQNSIFKTLAVVENEEKRRNGKANEHAEKISLRNASFVKILIGFFIAFVGWILWEKSVQAGVYFVFNILIFIPAITLIFKGILGLIVVYRK